MLSFVGFYLFYHTLVAKARESVVFAPRGQISPFFLRAIETKSSHLLDKHEKSWYYILKKSITLVLRSYQRKGLKALKDMKLTQRDDTLLSPLPTVEELRSLLSASDGSGTRKLIATLFDDGTFSELGVYTMRHFSEYTVSEETLSPEGVICGYGAVDGRLVYAFGQDISRMDGAMDEKHAEKIVDLYAEYSRKRSQLSYLRVTRATFPFADGFVTDVKLFSKLGLRKTFFLAESGDVFADVYLLFHISYLPYIIYMYAIFTL